MGDATDDVLEDSERFDDIGLFYERNKRLDRLEKSPPKPDKNGWIVPILDVVGHVTNADRSIMEKYFRLRWGKDFQLAKDKEFSLHLVVDGHSSLLKTCGRSYIAASFEAFQQAAMVRRIVELENKNDP